MFIFVASSLAYVLEKQGVSFVLVQTFEVGYLQIS